MAAVAEESTVNKMLTFYVREDSRATGGGGRSPEVCFLGTVLGFVVFVTLFLNTKRFKLLILCSYLNSSSQQKQV